MDWKSCLDAEGRTWGCPGLPGRICALRARTELSAVLEAVGPVSRGPWREPQSRPELWDQVGPTGHSTAGPTEPGSLLLLPCSCLVQGQCWKVQLLPPSRPNLGHHCPSQGTEAQGSGHLSQKPQSQRQKWTGITSKVLLRPEMGRWGQRLLGSKSHCTQQRPGALALLLSPAAGPAGHLLQKWGQHPPKHCWSTTGQAGLKLQGAPPRPQVSGWPAGDTHVQLGGQEAGSPLGPHFRARSGKV